MSDLRSSGRIQGHPLARPGASRVKIGFTLTSPFVYNAFLLGHLKKSTRLYSVHAFINRNESEVQPQKISRVSLVHVPILRKISLLYDLMALATLISHYREKRFLAVIGLTPKGGLLGMVAARLAGIPVRLHWFTGQVWSNQSGCRRLLLKSVDYLIGRLGTHFLADSDSQKRFLVREGILPWRKIQVLGAGSVCGVDEKRFRPNPTQRAAIRKKLGIPANAVSLIYVGRIKREKGVPELLQAFFELCPSLPNLHLMMVGPEEEKILPPSHPRIHPIGYTRKVEKFLAAADIICLPSHREGFGSVLIEAAACGVPAVASRIYGITDAVAEGETGLLHRPGDPADLKRRLKHLVTNAEARKKMGRQAKHRARQLFRKDHIEGLFSNYLEHLLRNASAQGKVHHLAHRSQRTRAGTGIS